MELNPRYDGAPIISIEGAPDDQLAPVTRQRRRLAAMLAELPDDDWAAPSRCDGWRVQDVVAHLIGVNAFWRASVTAGLSGSPTRLLTNFDPAATPPLMVAPMRALSPAEVLAQFVASNEGFLDALSGLDAPAWAMLAEAPPGHLPIRLLAHHALWDSWIHERDIALPLGATPTVEPDEVQSCIRYAAALSPAFALTASNPCAGVFSVEACDPASQFALEIGETVSVRDGAAPGEAPCLRGDAVQLVEALSIRGPLPPSCPGEWRQLLAGLATAFDAEPEFDSVEER